jgi:hypothetical protein
MTTRSFFSYLALVTAVVAGLLAALHFMVPQAQAHWKFAAASLCLFVFGVWLVLCHAAKA